SNSIPEAQQTAYLHGKIALGSVGGTLVNDHALTVALAAGISGSNYNFAELGFNSLSGFVYLDANNNGTKDSGEAGIAGVTLTLVGANAQAQLNVTTATATDG